MPLITIILLALASPQAKDPPPVEPDEALKQSGAGAATQPPPVGPAEGELGRQLDKARQGFELFPKEQPTLMPYLAEANTYGNQCLQGDALLKGDPLSAAAQAVKTALSQLGFNYSLWQSYDFVAMSNVVKGSDNVLNYYNALLYGTWHIFGTDEMGGTDGWLVIGANAGVGLGYDASEQSAQRNLGALGYPLGTDYGQQVYMYALAWQQSFLAGQLVVTAGYLDQEYYMDLNTYANNAYNQLINYEFLNPATMPWSYQGMGVVVQYQPVDWFYCMWGSAANNTKPRQDPFEGLSMDNWSNTFEFGYIDPAFLGMGKGIYRALPFVATVAGSTGGGILFNVEQQLWKEGPLGLFARGGFGNRNVTVVQGAEASFAGGMAIAGQTDSPLFKAENSYFAAGFYWLDAADNTLARQNEYGIELTYVFQLTETMTVQPDLQFIFDPVKNPAADTGAMFTMQLTFTW